MCGISGFVDLGGRHENIEPHTIIEKMLDRLSSRGPDGSGAWHGPPAHMGHRRLSIIDPSTSSSQPLRLENSRFVIVYNGEIYNYRVLRKELEDIGERFFSNGDTEVLLRGFKRFGLSWLKRLNGMFAAAIWDSARKNLTIFRDRFGIKPLYWTMINGAIVFASQISSLSMFPGFEARLDLDWLNEYLTFQYAHGSITPFAGVSMIEPGKALVFNSGSMNCQRATWAEQRVYAPDRTLGFEQASETILELFDNAVRNSLTADVPVGSYLSGGIDSGSIVTVASRYQKSMDTFTCGIDDPNFSMLDESAQALALASKSGCRFNLVEIASAEIPDMHARIIKTIEEPRLGILYQNDRAAELAGSRVKVCLSGAGGDELFGGYPWRYMTIRNAFDRESFLDGLYGFWQRVFDDDEKRRFLKADVLEKTDSRRPFEVFSERFPLPADFDYSEIGGRTWLCLRYECEGFLHGLLQIGDRLAGSYGMEERFPFLDNSLVDYLDKVPARFHWDPDENPADSRFHSGKLLLRSALAKIVSEEVAGRPKQGFSIPARQWFDGPLSDFLQRELASKDARILDYMEPAIVEHALASNRSGRSTSAAQIWSLLSLEAMLRTFFN